MPITIFKTEFFVLLQKMNELWLVIIAAFLVVCGHSRGVFARWGQGMNKSIIGLIKTALHTSRWARGARVVFHQLNWLQRRRCTVCWIGVKVAVLWAVQYMPWNVFLIKVLNNVWYFEQPILTMICSEAYLKHNWRNCLWKKQKSTNAEDNFVNRVTNMLLSKYQ